MNKLLIAGIVSLATLSIGAYAKDAAAPKKECKCPYVAMIEKYDANKDGKIDDTEKATMTDKEKARLDKMLAKCDTNKDGKIDEAEMAAMKAAKKAAAK